MGNWKIFQELILPWVMEYMPWRSVVIYVPFLHIFLMRWVFYAPLERAFITAMKQTIGLVLNTKSSKNKTNNNSNQEERSYDSIVRDALLQEGRNAGQKNNAVAPGGDGSPSSRDRYYAEDNNNFQQNNKDSSPYGDNYDSRSRRRNSGSENHFFQNGGPDENNSSASNNIPEGTAKSNSNPYGFRVTQKSSEVRQSVIISGNLPANIANNKGGELNDFTHGDGNSGANNSSSKKTIDSKTTTSSSPDQRPAPGINSANNSGQQHLSVPRKKSSNESASNNTQFDRPAWETAANPREAFNHFCTAFGDVQVPGLTVTLMDAVIRGFKGLFIAVGLWAAKQVTASGGDSFWFMYPVMQFIFLQKRLGTTRNFLLAVIAVYFPSLSYRVAICYHMSLVFLRELLDPGIIRVQSMYSSYKPGSLNIAAYFKLGQDTEEEEENLRK